MFSNKSVRQQVEVHFTKKKLKRLSNRTVLLICLLHVHLLTRFVIENAL